jgi:cell division protein FtsI/penicillin-binding protein 2
MDFISKFDHDQMQKLQSIPGIEFTLKQARLYPEKDLAINIIQSLERYYQRKISGQVGFTRSAVDGTGEDLLTHINWQKNEIDGQNIQTSINRQIQLLSENAIKDGVEKYQADSASIIIIKPQSGEIMAMASFEASPSATTKITNITNIFEPGSIFKPLVMAAALDTGNLDRNFICDQCSHPRQIGQYTISNWDNELHPNSTIDDIIKNSDNIGMTYVMDKLTINKFLVYFHKLKLDQKTGVELSGESISPPKTYWSDIDIATAAFGQGIAVNQLQMIQAFNTIANNGQIVNVHLNHLSPIITTPVYKNNTITQMKGILHYAVENSPVNQFRPKDMDVCAKSGTAQVAVLGGYTDSSTIGSYIGFSPCDNPKFTMIITINNPRSSPWGSSTAAPMWFELAQKLLPLL